MWTTPSIEAGRPRRQSLTLHLVTFALVDKTGKQLGKNNGDVSLNPGGTTSFLPQVTVLEMGFWGVKSLLCSCWLSEMKAFVVGGRTPGCFVWSRDGPEAPNSHRKEEITLRREPRKQSSAPPRRIASRGATARFKPSRDAAFTERRRPHPHPKTTPSGAVVNTNQNGVEIALVGNHTPRL